MEALLVQICVSSTKLTARSTFQALNEIPQSLTMIPHTLMDWTPVKSLTNLLVTPCLMLMEILMNALLPTSTSSWIHLQEIVGHTQQSPLFPQSISIRVHPKSLIGMPYAHSLHGHPHPASRTLSMSPPDMETAPHTQDYIKKHFKSRYPVFNIPRCSEAVATDTIFSDTPAVDDGSTMAQFFCGRDTLVCDAYGIKSTKQFINTLSDNIRKRGAMCWKPPSPFSNVHFRNTTKILQHRFFTLNFLLILL